LTQSIQPNDYVELHCHSSFSLLDGAALPEVLAARAANLGMPALALTDHDELGGAVRFAQATREVEIDGIIGAELTVAWGVARGASRPSSVASQRSTRNASRSTHLVLLAETREGYGNLSTLITRARMENARG
jgi:error-prone DNA polymerase